VIDRVVSLVAYYTFFGRMELCEPVSVKGSEWTASAVV